MSVIYGLSNLDCIFLVVQFARSERYGVRENAKMR